MQNSMYLVLLLIFVVMWQLVYFNPTASEIRGYYITYPAKNYRIGDLVLFCINNPMSIKVLRKLHLPEAKGACDQNMPYLLKKIVARSSDWIRINSEGVFINDVLYPDSKSDLSYNGVSLYPLRNINFVLESGQYFLLGDGGAHSYDSRYFGIVAESQIYRQAKLVWQRNKPFFY